MRKAYAPGRASVLVLLFCLLFSAVPTVRAQQQPPPATTRQTKQQKLQRPPIETPARPPVPAPQERIANVPPPYYDYPFGSETNKFQQLTVDDAITLALSNASLYQQAALEERIAREDVRQARAAFLPQFSLPLTYTGTTPSRVRFPEEPPTFSFVSASAINETTVLANVSGTIDIAGRLRAALSKAARFLKRRAPGHKLRDASWCLPPMTLISRSCSRGKRGGWRKKPSRWPKDSSPWRRT